MCKDCVKYKDTGAKYCLVCGDILEKKDSKEAAEEEMFKHASEDMELEKIKEEKNGL